MNIKELGVFSRCQELGIDYEHFNKIAGAYEVVETSKEAAEDHKQVASALYKIMESVSRGHTKAAQHLKAAANTEGWDENRTELMSTIYKYFSGLKHVKEANVLPGVFTATKALALLAALTGAGVGALYWQLKRDSRIESSKAESIKAQTQYYNQLSNDLENKLTEKYQYDDET